MFPWLSPGLPKLMSLLEHFVSYSGYKLNIQKHKSLPAIIYHTRTYVKSTISNGKLLI